MKRICIGFFLFLPCLALAQNTRDSLIKRTDTVRSLQEVTVNTSILKQLKQAAGNLTVVDAKPFYRSNITAVQLLKQTAGIKVKQDGGYGSRVEFFVNGSTGKQLKFFLDGMPIDNLGEATSINTIPVELIERIEIYKGVLPIELGADALGGAINIVSRTERRNYIDASYAFGSFGTHRASLLGRTVLGNKLYMSLQATGGYAKNNYEIDAEVPDQFYTPVLTKVRRFHDRFKNVLLKGEIGLENTSWADHLSLGLNFSALDRQLQNNLTMTQPYGRAFYQENLYSAQLKYRKRLKNGWSLASQITLNRSLSNNVDTSGNVYVWDGSVFDRRLKPDEAEMGEAKFLRATTNLSNHRIQLAWGPNDNFKLAFANTIQYFHRIGKDTLALNANDGLDYYAQPATMLKNVSGISIEQALLNQKLIISTALKNIYAKMKSHELVETALVPRAQNINNLGYNLAVTFAVSQRILLKSSYENALRLPDVEESFGNLMLIRPNANLRPEKSHNININALYTSSNFNVEVAGFNRIISNLIYLQTDTRGAGTSQNISNAHISGAELTFSGRLYKQLQFTLNGTYQDIRNKGMINAADDNQRYVDARLPNIPYLLGNLGLTYQIQNFITKGKSLQFWANANYTHSYFLYWAGDGDKSLKNIIPTQFVQNVGVTFAPSERLAFTLESFNVSNQKTYDNFNVQLPGRSFSFKTRFYLTQKQTN
ncbi:TonB-dependent receptor domain-containing protein [Pedobacter jamesrossensis]|uniref:TonB-dependent receptor domain-containing protein n=1 Tax=Pedobacter jamesrossensis TaxID=1908238 RepID=A0ABV8NL41_9SPHI